MINGASLWLEACEVEVKVANEVAARAIPASSFVICVARTKRGDVLTELIGVFMYILVVLDWVIGEARKTDCGGGARERWEP